MSQLQEMYVGMRANVSLIAEFPPGVYNQSTLKLGDQSLGNIDIGSIQCVQGKSIASQNGIRANKTFYERVHICFSLYAIPIEITLKYSF